MKVIVCVKEVPDTGVGLKIRGNEIDPDIPWVMNPSDEYALEEAIRLKEGFGGDVTAITVGPERAEAVLRGCIALGADRALRVKDDSIRDRDGLVTAKILACVIRGMGYDIILCGKESADLGHAQTGQVIAELLHLPCISAIKRLEVSPSAEKVTCMREVEGGMEVVECTLPAVFTAQKGLNIPRYATLPGIMRAKKAGIESLNVADLDLCDIKPKVRVTSLSYPPTRPGGRTIAGPLPDAVRELVRNLKGVIPI